MRRENEDTDTSTYGVRGFILEIKKLKKLKRQTLRRRARPDR